MRRASCAGPYDLRRFRVGAVPSTTAEAPDPVPVSTAGGAAVARWSVPVEAAAPAPAFRLRVAVTEDASTAPSSVAELVRGLITLDYV